MWSLAVIVMQFFYGLPQYEQLENAQQKKNPNKQKENTKQEKRAKQKENLTNYANSLRKRGAFERPPNSAPFWRSTDEKKNSNRECGTDDWVDE
jgi:uncharacterized short protein YbdD (DUF466 family)